MKEEQTYVDLLSKLYDDVESNAAIPEPKRKEILEMISRLMARLWKYSA